MELSLAKRLVREAAALGKFSSVGFTGGEATLFLDEILEIGEECRSCGLPFTLATAGQWATSKDSAIAVVASLASRGLIRINISHDHSHAKFVPREYILNALHATKEVGVPAYVVGTFFSPDESLENYLPEFVNTAGVFYHTKYVAKVGRAAKKDITQDTYGLQLELDNLCCYRRVNHDVVVWHDGAVYPCCSTFNRATPGIAVGNAYKSTLEELWHLIEGSLMLRVMKRQGFGEFYRIIKEFDPELYTQLPKADQAVGPCSLCNLLLSKAELSLRIKSVFSAYEDEKLTDFIDSLSKAQGEDAAIALIEKTLSQ